LLPGRVTGLGGYLGHKVSLAGCARARKQQESRKFHGANDTVYSSFDYTFRIGGMQQNPDLGIEGESIIQVLCSGCERILKSGKGCKTCGHWYNNSCGNVKAQVAESRTWNCNACRSERLQLLEEKLQNALLQTDEMTHKNKALEEQLQLVEAGKEVSKRYTVPVKHEGKKCLVLGDSVVQNVGKEYSNMTAECFLGIRTEQLLRVTENRELGKPDTAVIHVGTNNLRRSRYLDYVMGEVYSLVATAKSKFPHCRLVLSGILWCTDMIWQCIGAVNNRYDW
jgi:hypothetical protein